MQDMSKNHESTLHTMRLFWPVCGSNWVGEWKLLWSLSGDNFVFGWLLSGQQGFLILSLFTIVLMNGESDLLLTASLLGWMSYGSPTRLFCVWVLIVWYYAKCTINYHTHMGCVSLLTFSTCWSRESGYKMLVCVSEMWGEQWVNLLMSVAFWNKMPLTSFSLACSLLNKWS